jgi:hypothetical protein
LGFLTASIQCRRHSIPFRFKPKPKHVKTSHKPGEWNEMVVIALGNRVVVQVNGTPSAELKKDAGQYVDVLFTDVEIQEIPKAED